MNRKKAIIIGKHPLEESLKQQYETLQMDVSHFADDNTLPSKSEMNDCDELFVLTDPSKKQDEDIDSKAIAILGLLADKIDADALKGRRIICHLMLQSMRALQHLRTNDFCAPIKQLMDVYPFTMGEVWSRSIDLDYVPITIQSEQHAHLVIFGMNDIAYMVAIHATETAHYPNYVRDHSKRTRITLVDEHACSKYAELIQRYPCLFDNSYYRVVAPSDDNPVKLFHKPIYADLREDFVDVEWEFVEASLWNEELRDKLRMWATDPRQLLTVVIANDDGNRNLSEAMHLPDEMFRENIPIHVYSQRGFALSHCPNIHYFGMLDNGYDVLLPHVRMAKNVNYIYDCCYHDNYENWSGHMYYTVEMDADVCEQLWKQLSNLKRMSCICNAMTIPTKMRSIGLMQNEWDKFYDISQNDIETLAQVEHNRWCLEALVQNFRPCTESEQQIIEDDISQKKVMKQRKIHYDLRAYSDLRPDETGKSVQIYDICLCSCLPLIVKDFADKNQEFETTGNSKGGES